MKQRVTREQFEQLSETSQKKLMDWLSERGGWTSIGPTIGEMIEFLDDSGFNLYSVNTVEQEGKRIAFMITFRDESMKHALFGNKPELADALWEAVKDVLDRQDKNTS